MNVEELALDGKSILRQLLLAQLGLPLKFLDLDLDSGILQQSVPGSRMIAGIHRGSGCAPNADVCGTERQLLLCKDYSAAGTTSAFAEEIRAVRGGWAFAVGFFVHSRFSFKSSVVLLPLEIVENPSAFPTCFRQMRRYPLRRVCNKTQGNQESSGDLEPLWLSGGHRPLQE